jgi:hypothetical protein
MEEKDIIKRLEQAIRDRDTKALKENSSEILSRLWDREPDLSKFEGRVFARSFADGFFSEKGDLEGAKVVIGERRILGILTKDGELYFERFFGWKDLDTLIESWLIPDGEEEKKAWLTIWSPDDVEKEREEGPREILHATFENFKAFKEGESFMAHRNADLTGFHKLSVHEKYVKDTQYKSLVMVEKGSDADFYMTEEEEK